MLYVSPNQPGSKFTFKSRYENYINGKFVPPVKGRYFDNPSPITGLKRARQRDCVLCNHVVSFVFRLPKG